MKFELFNKVVDLLERKKGKLLFFAAVVTIMLIGVFTYTAAKIVPLVNKLENVVSHEKNLISSEQDESINALLCDAREALNASRVFHVIYHNGMVSLDGVGFKRASMMHESRVDNIQSYATSLNNIPMSFFSYWNTLFMKDEPICYPDIELVKSKERGIYYALSYNNIKSAYFVAYYTHDEKMEPVGFVGIEFTNKAKVLCPDELNYLSRVADKIDGILYNIKWRGE